MKNSSSDGAGAAAGGGSDASQPLYTRLARTLESLHASGALAPPKGTAAKGRKPDRGPPPFERWVWREGRYASFLAGTAATHTALEAAVRGALEAAGDASTLSPAFKVLSALGPEAGLGRAAAAEADLAALVATAAARKGGRDLKGGLKPEPPLTTAPEPPGPAKVAATYLTSLGRRCATGVRAGSGGDTTSPPSSSSLTPADADALRLFANAYALHVTHLTTGIRVGAAATEALGLFQKRATALFDGYEDSALPALSDPLRHFKACVDGVGEHVPEAGWGVIEAELVGAVQRAGGLYEAVARDD